MHEDCVNILFLTTWRSKGLTPSHDTGLTHNHHERGGRLNKSNKMLMYQLFTNDFGQGKMNLAHPLL